MHVKLLSGALEQMGESETQGASQLDRKCMLVYAGAFESMDGPVDITDEHIEQLAASHNQKAKLSGGKVKMKDMPPIQLDHSTSAKDTVGRLVGPLEVGSYEVDGRPVKALFGTARMLGKENVEKVQDGRWTHLSIGADLEKGKLTELTITPFPAAPDAAMLSRLKDDDWSKHDWRVVVREDKWNKGGYEYILYCDGSPQGTQGSTSSKADAEKSAAKILADAKKGLYEPPSRRFSAQPAQKLAEGDIEKDFDWSSTAILPGGLQVAYAYGDKGRRIGVFDRSVNEYRIFKNEANAIAWATKNKPKLSEQPAQKLAKVVDDKENRRQFESYKSKYSAVSAYIEELPAAVQQKFNNFEDPFTTGYDNIIDYAGELKDLEAFSKTHKKENKLSAQPAPSTKGDPMKTGFKKHLAESMKMADEDVEKKHAEMKKHLMDSKSMKDEDAEKHLAEADDAECKKLMEEKDAHEKQLAAVADAEKVKAEEEKAKMSAALSSIKKLSSDMRSSMTTAKLSVRAAEIRTRLSKFKTEAKVTPAELKAIDVTKLAKLSDEALEVLFETYSVRQPVIMAGMIGDTRAQDIAKAAKAQSEKVRLAKLEVDMRKSMGKEIPADLKRLAEGPAAAGMPEEVEIHIDATPHTHYDMAADWEQMKKLLAEGKEEDAKSHLKKMAQSMKGLVGEEAMEAPEVKAMTEEVAKMSAQIEELTKLTAQLAGEQ